MTDNYETSKNHSFENIDDRELDVVREARFFEPYKNDLRRLFEELDRGEQWSEDPTDEDFLSYLRRSWIGSEHGNATDKDQFTDEQIERVQPILERLGMLKVHLPPAGAHFDQTVVLGGTMGANYRRTELVEDAAESGIDVGDVVFLYGQRPREKRDGTNEELLSTTGKFGGHDITGNPWFHAYAEEALKSDDPWKLTETEFGRIALNKIAGGNLSPSQIHLPIVGVNGEDTEYARTLPDVPNRDVLEYDFVTENGRHVTLLNSAAVSRGDRPSRPKTKSTVGEWLERRAPEQGAKVLLVTGNPSAIRQTQATYQIAQEYGRGDIEFVVAATAPPENTPIQTYLGEIAALIIKDVERNYGDTKAAV